MSDFFDWIAGRIRNELTSQLATVNGGNLRSVFIGLPEEMLDDLLGYLVADGRMCLDVNGVANEMIVLLPTRTSSNPSGIGSGRCNQGYLVSVRNSSVKHLLTLQPPDETQIKSIRSTVTHFGVSPEGVMDARVWSEDEFVGRALLEAAKKRGLVHGKQAPGWLVDALSQLSVLDERDGHGDTKWAAMRRLFDQPTPDLANGDLLVSFAAMGLVCPADVQGSHQDLLQLVEGIGEFLEREGLVAGF